MAETKWARVTQSNMVRALGGLTLLGGSPTDPEVMATAKELNRALGIISQVTPAKVMDAWRETEATRLKAKPDAKPTPRELLEMAVAVRWACSRGTLRAVSTRRRFRYTGKTKQFFADLREFGRAKWTKAGEVIASSLNKGPGPWEYLDETPPGTDALCNHRASL